MIAAQGGLAPKLEMVMRKDDCEGRRVGLPGWFLESTVGPAIDNTQEGEGPEDLLLI